MNMKRTTIFAALLMFVSMAPAWADVIILDNGASYLGSIRAMDQNTVVLVDPQGIEMKIPRSRVRQINIGEVAPGAVMLQQAPSGPSLMHAPAMAGQQAPQPYKKVTLKELMQLPKGTRVTVRARYGRKSKPSTGIPQSNLFWYINDGTNEVEVVGETPEGLSSYSYEHWGSIVEVSGVVEKEKDGLLIKGKRKIKADRAVLIRRAVSTTPENY